MSSKNFSRVSLFPAKGLICPNRMSGVRLFGAVVSSTILIICFGSVVVISGSSIFFCSLVGSGMIGVISGVNDLKLSSASDSLVWISSFSGFLPVRSIKAANKFATGSDGSGRLKVLVVGSGVFFPHGSFRRKSSNEVDGMGGSLIVGSPPSILRLRGSSSSESVFDLKRDRPLREVVVSDVVPAYRKKQECH